MRAGSGAAWASGAALAAAAERLALSPAEATPAAVSTAGYSPQPVGGARPSSRSKLRDKRSDGFAGAYRGGRCEIASARGDARLGDAATCSTRARDVWTGPHQPRRRRARGSWLTEHRRQRCEGENGTPNIRKARRVQTASAIRARRPTGTGFALRFIAHRHRDRHSCRAAAPGPVDREARIEKGRRSKSPVERVARQLAYSPLVAISLTSTVTAVGSASMRTRKRSPTFRVAAGPAQVEMDQRSPDDQGDQRHAG
jgi:hypothetical protein